MSARIVPGFFLGATSGVFADRFDRKKLMVGCNIGRAVVLVCLPFVDTVVGLVFASLLLECFTLLWTPAKEASVPNLVPPDHLTTANSLSLVAAYGTMPLAGAIFSVLASVSKAIGEIDALDDFETNQVAIAFYVNAACFLVAAVMISRLQLPKHEKRPRNGDRRIDFGQAFHELKEGWSFIFINPVVRAVNVGLATGLIGGGMLVPLGPVFSAEVLDAGAAGFGILIFALGTGVAVGVVLLSVFQRHIPKPQVFAGSVFGAGVSLHHRGVHVVARARVAVRRRARASCAGSVYVLGFTLLHENVDDELRGRIFSALYTLVRFCVLLAFAVGPFLSGFLDRLSIVSSKARSPSPGCRSRCPASGSRCGSPGSSSWAPASSPPCRCARPPRSRPTPRTTSALDELLLQEGAELVSGLTGPVHRGPPEPRAGRGAPAGSGGRARPERGRRRVTRPLHRLRGRRGERQVHPGPAAGRAPRRRRRCSPSSPATRRSAPRCAASCSTRPTSTSPTGPRRSSWRPTAPSTSPR